MVEFTESKNIFFFVKVSLRMICNVELKRLRVLSRIIYKKDRYYKNATIKGYTNRFREFVFFYQKNSIKKIPRIFSKNSQVKIVSGKRIGYPQKNFFYN